MPDSVEGTLCAELEQPTAPTSIEETGLELGFLGDLALKTLYFAGNAPGGELATRLALPVTVTSEILAFLRRERLCEVTGGSGLSEAALVYSLTAAGLERAGAALAMSGYSGPAPVPLTSYFDCVREQTVQQVEISRAAIERGLSHLVLDQRTIDLVGQAISSKRPVLIYGASGNGKSTAADGLRGMLLGNVLMPHAVEVMHQVIQVYDPSVHELAGDPAPRTGRMLDQRWLKIKRPVVFAAGELAANHLELILDEVSKTYEAPVQMKANGGFLVIDDFGRQHLDAAYLLNRWIVPLEKGVDNLSLHSGTRFQTPFDAIPVFITNKQPADLADDAFLRRIRYKVEIPSPAPDLFEQILKRECEMNQVDYDQGAALYLIDKYFSHNGRQMRGCHPRDIVESIASAARYQGSVRALTQETVDEACLNYFV